MGTYFVGSNYTFDVFAYEGFSYTLSNPNPSVYTLQVVSNSTGFGPSPSSVYFTKNGNDSYTFGVSDTSNNLTAGTTESFTIQATGPTTLVSSNVVTVGAGRFLDGSGNSLSNTSYTFFKNEPIPPIRFVAPSFTLKNPLLAIPALPPGLSFVGNASNIYDLSGIPRVTVPTSNYQIIGVQDGGSKIVTTRINMTVSNERVRVNLSGTPIISGMQIGTAISPRVLTAVPPVGSTLVRYSYPVLPDGIVVTDINGTVQSGTSFIPSDPSFTMIIRGTPTSNAAYSFRNAGVTSNGAIYPIQVSRIAPTPVVDSSTALTFAFGETVLFDLSTVPVLYTGIPVDSSAVFFKAATYFTSNVGISNIISPDLALGLSLEFIPALSRANLTGTPTTAASSNYILRAINSNNITRDYTIPFVVSNDSATFTSPVGVDLCYNFILSRPVSLAKTGYYPGSIQFAASAASGRAVSLSAPALSGTGLALNGSGLITGTPTTVLPLTDLIVTATVSGSPATATKTVKFAILNDTFTFSDISASSLNFIQNVAATPFQVTATTLSERGVIGFSQIGLPSGLNISPVGVVSGTPTASSPTSGNVTFTATTGYASGSRDFSFNLTPDAMIFFTPQTSYNYNGGDPIGPIDIDGLTYSGLTVSNYDLSISDPYGMTLNATTGVLTGTWPTGVPPSQLLPRTCNFTITANAGQLSGTLNATLTGVSVIRDTLLVSQTLKGSPNDVYLFSIDRDDLTTANVVLTESSFSDVGYGHLRIKTNDASSNVILVGSSLNSVIWRGTNLGNLQSNAQVVQLWSFVNHPGTTTWWAGGYEIATPTTSINLSSDDGQTWSQLASLKNSANEYLLTRNSNGARNLYTTPYASSFSLAYSPDHSILVAGGLGGTGYQTMLRSTTQGATWSNVTGGFNKECGGLSLDNSAVWVATGSDLYETTDTYLSYSAATDTIKYSLNQGASWINAVGTFNMFGYEVVYGSNTWIASGMSYDSMTTQYNPELRFSTNGSTWTKFDLSTGVITVPQTLATNMIAPLPIGPIVFDDDYWYVFVNQNALKTVIYRHDVSTSLTSGWVPFDVSGISASQPFQLHSATPSRYVYTSNHPVQLRLSFPGGNGPIFTSPSSRTFLQYQYVPISPIQLSASAIGPLYFFITASDLPPGLTFNPRTNQITGKIVEAGTVTVPVYAKDNIGVSTITLTFTTILPRIIRKQDGAGAYTSLLRQYTEVLGAQNARDSKVYPTQESKLGEFMSPEAPDVITQTVDPSCFGPSNCP